MPWDDDLSPEQKAIIADPARIKIVRAGPGTGKTRLFVGALQKALEDWHDQRAGIAALSFTNVAQQQIEQRAGQLPHPHLTTTIDGFILRFIIRPFAHLITQNHNGTRLLPAPIAQHYNADVQIGPHRAQRSRLTDITFIGRDDQGNIRLNGVTQYRAAAVHENRRNEVLRQKLRVWRYQGLVTHSDTHFLAYQLLHHPDHGEAIARLITQRFPIILVDEYQDTNYFLAHTIATLLAQPTVHGLIVGDADQSIYEFGGAHPSLMNDLEQLEGSKNFDLRQTYRCPSNVAAVASHLAHSHNPVEPTGVPGNAIIIAHDNTTTTLEQTLAAYRQTGDRIAVLARRTDTLDDLRGHPTSDFPGGCKLAAELHKAATILPVDARRAGQLASAALSTFALEDAFPTKTVLDQHNITQQQWRQAVWHLLTTAATIVDGETWAGWIARLRPSLRHAVTTLGLTIEDERINRALRTTQDMAGLRQPPVFTPPPLWLNDVMLSTVHGVKGDEFDIVILHCPEPAKSGVRRCITQQWWNDQTTEERRVAFVATTRAKSVFILSVHQLTYNALRTLQPAFFTTFNEHHDLGH
ncbi:MAG: ATP-dependent helicase [Acidobacteria bacterium]|nr:ATP-dependent helicase [Acidobacteriota bacterium]